LHQTPFIPDNLLHNTLWTPDTCYTRHLLHQPPFTPEVFYSRHLLRQVIFTPETFLTTHCFHQTHFLPDTFHTNNLLHRNPCTADTFYTKWLFPPETQTPFTPDNLLQDRLFTPDTFYTRDLLHQPPSTPDIEPFTPRTHCMSIRRGRNAVAPYMWLQISQCPRDASWSYTWFIFNAIHAHAEDT